MSDDPFPDWFLWAAIGWVTFVILLSVLVRKGSGKPIVPRVPADAVFAERRASGRMASNCLIVAVTPRTLLITPRFPFNLGFLPEIYGLEHTIARADLREVSCTGSHWGNNVAVTYGPQGRRLGLRLHDPAGFVAALAGRPST